jgi:hypothetical protein
MVIEREVSRMITYQNLKEAQEELVNAWGDDGKEVIRMCWVNRHSMPMKEFLSHCTACGGDWGAMLLTGIRRLSQEVYDAIPNDMGVHAFISLLHVLMLMGVDTSAE